MRSLDEYIDLMEAFATGQVPAETFERRYLDLFKSDTAMRGPSIFPVVEDVFFAVDEYCADPALRDEYDIDEDQLRERVCGALRALAALETPV